MKIISLAILAIGIMGTGSWTEAGTISGKVELVGLKPSERIVVYVEGADANYRMPPKSPQIDHKNQQFDPRTLVVVKGTTVDFLNSDQVFHSAFSISKPNPFDLGIYGPGQVNSVSFENPGLVEIFCHIHEHMYGFILVVENPFFAMVDEKGSFVISGLPKGDYSVKAWMGPRFNDTKNVTINGDEKVSLKFTLAKD